MQHLLLSQGYTFYCFPEHWMLECQMHHCLITYNYVIMLNRLGFAFEELIKEDLGEKCNFYLDDEARDLEQLVISFAQVRKCFPSC